ncbi:MAG: HAMP domain-containing sensor histidine kinase [Bacteroidota bacterium]
MAKDTFSLPNKIKLPLITKSVKQNSIWVISSLMIVFLIFNFVMMLQINVYFKDTIDSKLQHEIEHIKFALIFQNDSLVIDHPREFQETDMVEVSENSFFLQVYKSNGEILFSSKNLENYEIIPVEHIEFEDEYYFKDLNIKYTGLRTGYTKLSDSSSNSTVFIQLSTPKIKMNEVVEKIIGLNIYLLPVIVFLFALISLFFIKRTLNPINKIINIAEDISATNISKRINYDADSNDEFGRLRDTLNDLFDRLEFQISQISQFSDNASHQLMTPLTAINTELEYILNKGEPKEECRESFNVIKFQTEQMIHIVKTLLILARDCEVCASSNKVFNLSSLIKEDISQSFLDKNIAVDVEKNIYILGEADYFRMVIENILNNGLKYSNDGKVKLSAKTSGNKVKIEISDNGIGIPDEEKNKVFERFYRGQQSEKDGIRGYGLGLSLAKLVITKMKGYLYIEDNTPHGSIFIIELPIVNME